MRQLPHIPRIPALKQRTKTFNGIQPIALPSIYRYHPPIVTAQSPHSRNSNSNNEVCQFERVVLRRAWRWPNVPKTFSFKLWYWICKWKSFTGVDFHLLMTSPNFQLDYKIVTTPPNGLTKIPRWPQSLQPTTNTDQSTSAPSEITHSDMIHEQNS